MHLFYTFVYHHYIVLSFLPHLIISLCWFKTKINGMEHNDNIQPDGAFSPRPTRFSSWPRLYMLQYDFEKFQ